ncbi:tectonin domain-containing protein, partial [Streptomyces albipurpureus]
QGSTDWVPVSGGLTRITAGSRTTVWGINSSDQIYRYTNHDANPWVGIPGAAVDIGAASDGTVWCVNSGGGIYRYTGDQPS